MRLIGVSGSFLESHCSQPFTMFTAPDIIDRLFYCMRKVRSFDDLASVIIVSMQSNCVECSFIEIVMLEEGRKMRISSASCYPMFRIMIECVIFKKFGSVFIISLGCNPIFHVFQFRNIMVPQKFGMVFVGSVSRNDIFCCVWYLVLL